MFESMNQITGLGGGEVDSYKDLNCGHFLSLRDRVSSYMWIALRVGINGGCATTNCDDNNNDATTDSGRSLIVPSLHNNLKSRPFSTSYTHHTQT